LRDRTRGDRRREDGGAKTRLRCAACGYTHWNNPTPVLAGDRVRRPRRPVAAGAQRRLERALVRPRHRLHGGGRIAAEGIAREVAEETSLEVDALNLIGVYDFQRMNQVIIAYHALARGEIRLSPELAEYRLFSPEDVRCWRAGTGYALADWLRARGHEPRWIELPPRRNLESMPDKDRR
jgi:ADP-ribose pyrophosphatase YjhB (NUDIX family)